MFKHLPLSFLLLSNLVPVAGVLLAGWDAASIVLIYWAENLVIGAYNILKMLTVAPLKLKEIPARLFIILFFMLHYGGFAAGHGTFLLEFFHIGAEEGISPVVADWPGPLILLQMLFKVLQTIWSNMPSGFLWAIFALVVSHGVSYLYNFIIAGERYKITTKRLMGQPYGRVVIMHIAIIAASFFVIKLGSSLSMLLALVAVKTAMDIHLHKKSHEKIQRKDVNKNNKDDETESRST